MSRKIFILCILVIMVVVGTLMCYFNYYGNKRLNYIIDIPLSAFDSTGHLADYHWRQFLKKHKPVGVIFFADHLENKELARQMIKDVRDAIAEKDVFLSADEEGGRVNRMGWIDIPSASEISERYTYLKQTQGKKMATMYVESEYGKMFQEMQDVGLNLTFAPNLDINVYGDLEKNSDDYGYYTQAVEYVKMSRRKRTTLTEEEKKEYQKTLHFYAYLDEIGIKSLDIFTVDGKISDNKEFIETIRNNWQTLENNHKQQLIKEFKPIIPYINYASVVGDRSFGKSPYLIAEMAKIFVNTAKKYGIKCVLKHALGHGRVMGDTHNGILHVKTPIDIILDDLYPYKQLINEVKFVMPAYIVYEEIDDKNTAVASDKVLQFFRKNIGDAVFIGDDMSMRGNNNNIQKCDIHIKSHNNNVNDMLQIINKESYVGRSTWKKWFK